ncbi:MAG: hypothetical protein COA66_11225 [Arcobacter sp.]|nr:MAG: hypothetical protein COA66_11225 [Arcobacter sp.]
MKTLLLLLFCPLIILASIGKITSVKGEVYIDRENAKISAKVGSILELKDHVITKNNSKVILLFNDNTSITLGKSSTLQVRKYVFDTNIKSNNKATFGFGKGIFRTITGKLGQLNPKGFKIKTSTATIGIRGSDGRMVVDGQGRVQLSVFAGGFTVTVNGRTVFIPKGATGTTSNTGVNILPTTTETFSESSELVEQEAEELKKEEEQENKEQTDETGQTNEKEESQEEQKNEEQAENNVNLDSQNEVTQVVNNDFNDNNDTNNNEQTNETATNILIDIEALSQSELDDYIIGDTFTLSNDYLTPSNIIQGYIDGGTDYLQYTGTITGLKNGVTSLTGNISILIDYGDASAYGDISNLDAFGTDFEADITSSGLSNVVIDPYQGSDVNGTLTGSFYGDSGNVLGGSMNLTKYGDSFEGQYITKGAPFNP